MSQDLHAHWIIIHMEGKKASLCCYWHRRSSLTPSKAQEHELNNQKHPTQHQWRYECKSGKERPAHGHGTRTKETLAPRGARSRHDPFSALRPAHVDPMLGIRIPRIQKNGGFREPHVSGFAHPLNYPYGRKKGQPLLLLASSFQPNQLMPGKAEEDELNKQKHPTQHEMKLWMQFGQRKILVNGHGHRKSNSGPRGAQSPHHPFSALRPVHVDSCNASKMTHHGIKNHLIDFNRI